MRSIATTILLVALAACQQNEPSNTPSPTPALAQGNEMPTPATGEPGAIAPPTTETAERAADECGAGKLDRWLNVLPTDTVKAEIAATVGDRPIRYYGPDDAITMDYSAERLNAELGEDGRIKRFRCG